MVGLLECVAGAEFIPCASEAEWRGERLRGIGGSDAAAAVGLSPWSSPAELYLQKTSEEPAESIQNESFYWGSALEPAIRQRYCDDLGEEVHKPAGIFRSRKYPFMLASVDGVSAGGRLLEIKTARTYQGWEDAVPDHYQIQVQHYLAVLGLGVADVAVLIGGVDYRVFQVEADTEIQTDLIAVESEFWDRVASRRPPDPSNAQAARRLWPRSREKRVEATEAAFAACAELRELKARAAETELRIERAQSRIMIELGESDTLVRGDKVLATWKSTKPTKSFNKEGFRTAHPKLWEEYQVEGLPQRRFLLRGE